MAFTRTWNTSYESSPPDNQVAKQGAARIREVKEDARERLEIDHSWAGDTHDGKHKQVTMRKSSSDPANAADQGVSYTKDVGSGVIEYFYVDESGNVTQLTSVGKIAILKSKNNWEKAQYTAPSTLTDGATVTPDLNLSNVFTWAIGGNRTLAAPTNAAAGQSFLIKITQDGTGNRTITYNSVYKFQAGHSKQPSSGANEVSMLSCLHDGTNVLCVMLRDFE